MPLTFLSHQAPLLPLKIAAPRWVDGTALVLGSMAPDLTFVLDGTALSIDAHTQLVPFVLTVPSTVLLVWVVKRVIAAPFGSHLPDGGPFHLRDYARLGAWRFPRRPLGLVILVLSAFLGSLSHVAIDSCTHGFGWTVERVAFLRIEVVELPVIGTVFLYDAAQIIGTFLGLAVTVWCLALIGSRRLLVLWYPNVRPPAPTRSSTGRLLTGVVAGAVGGAIIAVATREVGGAQDVILRVVGLLFLGLIAGCVAAHRSMAAPHLRPLATRPETGSETGKGDHGPLSTSTGGPTLGGP